MKHQTNHPSLISPTCQSSILTYLSISRMKQHLVRRKRRPDSGGERSDDRTICHRGSCGRRKVFEIQLADDGELESEAADIEFQMKARDIRDLCL